MQRRGSNSEAETLEGLWSPSQIADALGVHRQTAVDALYGKTRYPGKLPIVRFGQRIFVPEAHAQAYIHWIRTGELIDVPEPTERLYWTTAEVADAAGIHRSTVIKAIAGRRGYEKRLPGVKVAGKTWLVKDADARQFIRRYSGEQ